MLLQKKEKEYTDSMEDKWEPEEVITETTETEIPVNKEDLHSKPPEPEELVKPIQLLDHQLPQEHKKLMQHKEQLPMQQLELHLIHLPHGLQPMQWMSHSMKQITSN